MTDELREPCIHGQREYQGETCHDCDLDRMAAQYEKELAEKDRRIGELENELNVMKLKCQCHLYGAQQEYVHQLEKELAEEKELKLWHQGLAGKERGEVEALRAKNAELERELDEWKKQYPCCEGSARCSNNKTKKLVEHFLGKGEWTEKKDSLYLIIEEIELERDMQRIEREKLEKKNAELEAEIQRLKEERKNMSDVRYAWKDDAERLRAQNTALVAERDKLKEAVRGLVEALEFYSDGENWHSRTDGMRQFACVDPRDEEYRPLTKDNFSIKRGGKIAIEALTRFREVCEWK